MHNLDSPVTCRDDNERLPLEDRRDGMLDLSQLCDHWFGLMTDTLRLDRLDTETNNLEDNTRTAVSCTDKNNESSLITWSQKVVAKHFLLCHRDSVYGMVLFFHTLHQSKASWGFSLLVFSSLLLFVCVCRVR